MVMLLSWRGVRMVVSDFTFTLFEMISSVRVPELGGSLRWRMCLRAGRLYLFR